MDKKQAIDEVLKASMSGGDPAKALQNLALVVLTSRLALMASEDRVLELARVKNRLEDTRNAHTLEPSWDEREAARQFTIAAKDEEWRTKYAWRWMLDPRLSFTTGEYDLVNDAPVLSPGPFLAPGEEWRVEEIRRLAQEWEAAGRPRKLKSWFFDNISEWNWDWERIVAVENAAEDIFKGRPVSLNIEEWAFIPDGWAPDL